MTVIKATIAAVYFHWQGWMYLKVGIPASKIHQDAEAQEIIAARYSKAALLYHETTVLGAGKSFRERSCARVCKKEPNGRLGVAQPPLRNIPPPKENFLLNEGPNSFPSNPQIMAVALISTQSEPSSPDSPQVTNTVTVTSLPKSFFDPLILGMLRDHFSHFGDINQWVPLQGFGRIIVVYEAEHHAESAKRNSDPIIVDGHGR
jgi:hypothetical protein